MTQLTHGSLFSGIGGFDLGFERAGIKTVWQVEIDPFCRKVLEKHWPNVQRYSDIRECRELPDCDIITGGFPCQDVSQANTYGAEGLDGERSGLWSEMRRIICELRPKFVLVENVPALTFRGLGRVLGDLAAGGYDAEWDCIPAASLGAAHIRDRIWVLAYPAGQRFQLRVSGGNECVSAVEQGDDREKAERSANWKLIAMVEGVCHGTASDWWQSQSRMVRSANGIPNWMDRIHGLGNAVVPQIAEWIGRRIVACHERSGS